MEQGTDMALAVDFLVVIDEWRSSPLDFAWTEIRVQARLLRSFERKYAPRPRHQKLYSLPEMDSFLQVYGSQSSNKKLKIRVSIPREAAPRVNTRKLKYYDSILT